MAKRLLVIRLSALGDVAMLCAVIREAAIAYPERKYTLLSRPTMVGLLWNMPSNVKFLAWPRHQNPKINWSEYDEVVDAHSVWRSWGLDIEALFHGKKVRQLSKPRLARLLLRGGISVRYSSMIDRYRRLLNVTRADTPLDSPKEKQREGIGIAPFAAHKSKCYPIDKMEEVVKALSQKGETIYIFGGGEKEQAQAERWAEQYKNVVSMVGRYKLDEEMAIIARLRVMLTMDSSNMHIASLVGTPTVTIWGATSPAMGFLGYGQRQEDCIQREDLDCRPCSVFGKTRCKYGDYRCMQIDPQQITDHLAHRD